MGKSFYFAWEVSLLEWLQEVFGGIGASIWSAVTMLGEELVIVGVLGFLYWSFDKNYGRFVGTNLLVALVWNPMIKNIFVRRRPYMDHAGITCLKPIEADADVMDITAQGYSFPSGHSTNAMTVYGSLWAYRRRSRVLLVLAILLPLLVGLSRMCLGVHYPTDVLCGWLLGLIAVAVISYCQRRVKRRWVFYLVLLLTALPGCFYCTSTDYFTAFGMLIGFSLGDLFETRFVHFEETRKPLWMVLRLLCGVGLFLGLNAVLKLPFPSEFLESAVPLSRLVRVLRYAVVLFTVIGVYPMLFRVVERKGTKRENQETNAEEASNEGC